MNLACCVSRSRLDSPLARCDPNPHNVSTTRRACGQEILEELARLSALAPELRLGQMVANSTLLAAGPWDQTLRDLEDEQLLAALKQQVADFSNRQPVVTGGAA